MTMHTTIWRTSAVAKLEALVPDDYDKDAATATAAALAASKADEEAKWSWPGLVSFPIRRILGGGILTRGRRLHARVI
jgi:hypothetical protein